MWRVAWRGARAQQEAGPLLLSWPGLAVPSLVQLPFPRSSGSARVVRGRACVKTASSVTSITDNQVFAKLRFLDEVVSSIIVANGIVG